MERTENNACGALGIKRRRDLEEVWIDLENGAVITVSAVF